MKYGNDDLAKYTFMPEAGDYIRKNEISIAELVSPTFKHVLERAEERVLEAIRSTKVSDKRVVNQDVEIMSFPVALMLVRSTNLNHLMDRYSLAEAIRVESLLKQENKEEIIEDIFHTFLGVQLEHSTVSNFPGFKISLSEFAKRAVKFHKPEWKLVNRIVQDGKVYVSQTDLIRLIREEIRDLILQRLKATNVPKLPKELDTIVKKLIELTPPPRTTFTTLNIAPENYPPCLKESLRLLEKGENVPHYGRFLMTTYLLAVGKSVEDIMGLFPKSPDFKKSVTQYQVEHIAGIKGGRTKYTVPSCKTLQTHSFCFKDPVKCYEISSPLQYPSRKLPVSDNEDKGRKQRTSPKEEKKRMDEDSKLILTRYFKEYYFRNSGKIKRPSEMESREFGYIHFGGGMIRHLSYTDIGAFRALLVKEAPAGVFCSNSYYHEPSAEMQNKGWIKADPIFDIDADLLKLPCKKDHDVWLCKQCGKKEFGLRPEICPACKGNKILEFTWACPLCLEGSKRETLRLLDFLKSDFGITDAQIQVCFSGNAGYHIEVAKSPLELLDQHGRSEISDYLTAQGAMTTVYNTPRLSPNDPGWRGRVARYIRDLPPNTPPFRTSEFPSRLQELIKDFESDHMEKILQLAIKSSAVRIDAMVTADIHRIFRMPETLNQKTGLVKKECDDLLSFDPMTRAIALPDENEQAEVMIDICPKVELGGNAYGPYRNEKKKLPLYVAVYLIAKGAAKIEAPTETKIQAS